MVFFWVPTESTMGIIQRINYVHVPMAWITELAFGLTAFASVIYLWRCSSPGLSGAKSLGAPFGPTTPG